MRVTRIKNIDSQENTYGGKVFEINEEYYIPETLLSNFRKDELLLLNVASGKADIGNGDKYFTTYPDRLSWLLGDECLPIDAHVVEQTPFAVPLYRTKRNATSNLITVAVNDSEDIDFLLTAERYVSGGCILIEGAEFGDYATAEIVDIDEVIPEAYRAALCESWPTVATYIEKEWIGPCGSSGIAKHEINTYPLNAKVTAGLYLRVTYYACNVGSSRRVAVNYYLTKKL